VSRRTNVCAAVGVAIAVTLVGVGCCYNDSLTLDQAAEVDSAATGSESDVATAGLFGTADVSFAGVTASIGGVSCSNEGRLVVTPIVSDSFTLLVDGDPAAGTWNVRVTQPGDPEVLWTAVDPSVDLDGDALAGNAQMQRADDPTVTATLAFVVDC
jgi:hypothetical protein